MCFWSEVTEFCCHLPSTLEPNKPTDKNQGNRYIHSFFLSTLPITTLHTTREMLNSFWEEKKKKKKSTFLDSSPHICSILFYIILLISELEDNKKNVWLYKIQFPHNCNWTKQLQNFSQLLELECISGLLNSELKEKSSVETHLQFNSNRFLLPLRIFVKLKGQ